MVTQDSNNSQENAGVVILSTHTEAENAVKELQRADFDVRRLSIIGKDYHTEEHVIGAGDRKGFWGKQNIFQGGLWGSLLGSAFYYIPVTGPIVVAGPIVSAILTGLQGAVMVGGLSVIGTAFDSIGIPEDSILKYETALKSESWIVLLHGSADELTWARSILGNMGHEVQVHLKCKR